MRNGTWIGVCALLMGCVSSSKSGDTGESLVGGGSSAGECGCPSDNNAPRDPVESVQVAALHLSGHARQEASGDVTIVLNPVVRTGQAERIRRLDAEQLTVTMDATEVPLADLSKVDADHPVSTDIVFVLDTTGSMAWAIGGVQAGVRSFLDVVKASGIDAKVGGVEYGDHVRTSIDLTTAGDVRSWVGGLSATGGADAAESPLDAILHAYDTFSWRPDAQRFMVVVTDEGMNECGVGCSETTLAEVVDVTGGNVLYGVVHAKLWDPSGVDPKKLVRAAGGLYVSPSELDLLDFDISDDTPLDDFLADTHVLTVAAEDVPEGASSVMVELTDGADTAFVEFRF